MKDYFRDVFNNKVDIKGEVVGFYWMLKLILYYVNEENGIGSMVLNVRIMV